jgi:hypothetical protein
MSTRTTETTVTLIRSFVLTAVAGVQPAGTYRLVTEEEQIPGLSFAAFQRRATMLHLLVDPPPGLAHYVVQVATALAADTSRIPRMQ